MLLLVLIYTNSEQARSYYTSLKFIIYVWIFKLSVWCWIYWLCNIYPSFSSVHCNAVCQTFVFVVIKQNSHFLTPVFAHSLFSGQKQFLKVAKKSGSFKLWKSRWIDGKIMVDGRVKKCQWTGISFQNSLISKASSWEAANNVKFHSWSLENVFRIIC